MYCWKSSGQKTVVTNIGETLTFFEILRIRSEYEEIITYRKSYNLPTLNSDISSLNYFINEGYKKNRLRKNSQKALDLAKQIVNYNEKSNIPILHSI